MILDLEEALRWCYRHAAMVDYQDLDSRGGRVCVVTVPLRHPEGDCAAEEARVDHPNQAADVIPQLVEKLRERTLLE